MDLGEFIDEIFEVFLPTTDVSVHLALLEQASFGVFDAGRTCLNHRDDNPNALSPIKAGTITEPKRGNDNHYRYNRNPRR